MKTRVLKVLGIALITVSLAVSFFAIPVSAASQLYSVTFEFPVQAADSQYFRYWDTVTGANNREWDELGDSSRGIYDPDSGSVTYYWNWNVVDSTDNSGWCSFFIGRSNFGGVTSYSAGDTIWNDPFTFTLYLPTRYSNATYMRLALREVYGGSTIGKRVGNTSWYNIDIYNNGQTGGNVHSITFPRDQFTITESGQYDGLSVHIEFQCASMDPEMGIGSNQSALTMYYGAGIDPNYPTYQPPDNSVFVEDDQLNNEVMNQIGSLESDVSGIFDNIGSSLSNFRGALILCTQILNRFIDSTHFKPIIQISLALGITASLLGIAGSIIGAASRPSRRDD